MRKNGYRDILDMADLAESDACTGRGMDDLLLRDRHMVEDLILCPAI